MVQTVEVVRMGENMRITGVICAALLMAIPGAVHAASSDVIAKGEYLARAGNCIVCHTAPGGEAFAGGLKMAIPVLGAIYTTNITPDKETGIGDYTFEDFEGAMRRGVAKDGHLLYPAMPYPSYANIGEDDLRALYAFFLEAVPAVKRANQPSEIRSPLNMRWPLAIWNLLFTNAPGYKPNDQKDAQWNRGAYLVEGLGHCGSCHTPRGIVFQEKALKADSAVYLSGAELDYWYASNLRSEPIRGLGRWTEADTVEFLKTGHNAYGTAYGTMIDVVNNSTQFLTDGDLQAIAVYLKSLPGGNEKAVYTYDQTTTDGLLRGALDAPGAKTYFQKCSTCHGLDGKGHPPYLPTIAGNPSIQDADPSSLVNITLNGSARIVVSGLPDAYRMPQFRVLLSDQEIADVVTFIRGGWGHKAGAVTPAQVAKIRSVTDPASDAVVVLKMR